MSFFIHIARCHNCGSRSHIVFTTSTSNILLHKQYQCICQHCGDSQGIFCNSKEAAIHAWNDYQSEKAALPSRDIDTIEVIPEDLFACKRFPGDTWGTCFDMVSKKSLRNFIKHLLRLKHDVNNMIDAAQSLESEVF